MKKLALLFISSALLISCGNDPATSSVQTTEPVTNEPGNHESEHLQLNDGAKWKVNEDMMVHVVKMKEDVSSFDGSTLKQHILLASGLKVHISNITSNCTMEGKAHDELHKWLIPYISLIDELNESTTEEAAQDKLSEIKNSLETFDTYFQ